MTEAASVVRNQIQPNGSSDARAKAGPQLLQYQVAEENQTMYPIILSSILVSLASAFSGPYNTAGGCPDPNKICVHLVSDINAVPSKISVCRHA